MRPRHRPAEGMALAVATAGSRGSPAIPPTSAGGGGAHRELPKRCASSSSGSPRRIRAGLPLTYSPPTTPRGDTSTARGGGSFLSSPAMALHMMSIFSLRILSMADSTLSLKGRIRQSK